MKKLISLMLVVTTILTGAVAVTAQERPLHNRLDNRAARMEICNNENICSFIEDEPRNERQHRRYERNIARIRQNGGTHEEANHCPNHYNDNTLERSHRSRARAACPNGR